MLAVRLLLIGMAVASISRHRLSGEGGAWQQRSNLVLTAA